MLQPASPPAAVLCGHRTTVLFTIASNGPKPCSGSDASTGCLQIEQYAFVLSDTLHTRQNRCSHAPARRGSRRKPLQIPHTKVSFTPPTTRPRGISHKLWRSSSIIGVAGVGGGQGSSSIAVVSMGCKEL
jgi:hypothetical protein